MKKNLAYTFVAALVIAGASILSVSTTGCKTINGQTTFSLPQAAASLQLAANLGAYYAIQSDPSTRPIFVAVTAGLDLALSNNVVSGVDLQNAILPLVGTNKLVRLAVMGAIGTYEISFGDAASSGIASNVIASSLITAVDAGFKEALVQPMGLQPPALKAYRASKPFRLAQPKR